MNVVADASALLQAWLDPDADALRLRLGTGTLHAPDILPFEIANVLRRQRNNGILPASRADEAFEGLRANPVQYWPSRVVADRVWELGANATSYDASYIALAEMLDVPLLTHDAKLARVPGIRCIIEVF